MRAATLALIALILVSAGRAEAANWCPLAWCSRAEALVRHWLGGPANRDPEIIRPPPGIDPRMALAPPGTSGTLRIIRPRAWPEQQ